MSVVRTLSLGGLLIPVHAGARTLSQELEPLQATSRRRTADGTSRQQTVWSGKWRVRISASGVVPVGIQTLDFTGALTFASAQHVAVSSATTTATLPAARRTDTGYEPIGHALFADGRSQSTAVSVTGDTATLTAVSGAALYQVLYWPAFSAHFDPPTQRRGRGNEYFWSLEGEEV